MQSISSTQKNIFINGEANKGHKQSIKPAVQTSEEQTPHKQHIVKLGSKQNMADAEAMFERANSYANVSAKIQKNIAAYEAIEVSQKRESLSQMMGVDLYA